MIERSNLFSLNLTIKLATIGIEKRYNNLWRLQEHLV
jgi:hypothetical protein